MNELFRAIGDLLKSLRVWAIIAPWEQGLLVRCGKWKQTLLPGFHWKLPWLDQVHVLPIRRQFVNLPLLDLIFSDGAPITIGLTVGFTITSVDALLNSVSQPEDAVSDLVSSFVAAYVRKATKNGFLQEKLECEAKERLSKAISGLGEITVSITSISTGRRFRLIMDKRWSSWAKTIEAERR